MAKIKNSIQDIKDTVSKISTVMKACIGKALYIEANKEDVEGLVEEYENYLRTE